MAGRAEHVEQVRRQQRVDPFQQAAAADAQAREARAGARRRARRDASRAGPERGAEPLRVRRDRLVADSLAALLRAPASALRRRLRVEFVGEAGVDAGGLARDWCLALSRAHMLAGDTVQTSAELVRDVGLHVAGCCRWLCHYQRRIAQQLLFLR